MHQNQRKIRVAVRRNHGHVNLLISLVAFAVTVIATRTFLELTGYPQLGTSVLHIAHALWGGLLLIIAAFLPLAYANGWVIRLSAVLSGIGIGLFIDEVGKFITQSNDYFFPPALPLIYAFILLNVLLYLYFRRQLETNPRRAMYHVLEGLQEVLDSDLDTGEAALIEEQLAVVKRSDQAELRSLAEAIGDYLQGQKGQLPPDELGYAERFTIWVDGLGQRLGRRWHRAIISFSLIAWLVVVLAYDALIIFGSTSLAPQVGQWRYPLVFIQAAVGTLILIAAFFWLRGDEQTGLKFGVIGILISLVALQLFYFYLVQFSAIIITLLQLAILLFFFTYRRWYLQPGD